MLRNTFLNSQMGPLPPPNREEAQVERRRALQWIDNEKEKTQGPLLVVSKSSDDLNLKEKIEPIVTHHKPRKLKPAIKQFSLDINALTGIHNFTQISPDPLKLPPYALELTNSTCPPLEQPEPPHQAQQHQHPEQDLFYKKDSINDVIVVESEAEEIEVKDTVQN